MFIKTLGKLHKFNRYRPGFAGAEEAAEKLDIS
jgi:hypothetical protein